MEESDEYEEFDECSPDSASMWDDTGAEMSYEWDVSRHASDASTSRDTDERAEPGGAEDHARPLHGDEWRQHFNQDNHQRPNAHNRQLPKPKKQRNIAPSNSSGQDSDEEDAVSNTSNSPAQGGNDKFATESPTSMDGDEWQERAFVRPVDARSMNDFNACHFGEGITPQAPLFGQGCAGNTCWKSLSNMKDSERQWTAKRQMCYNIPASLFARDGTRFRHWSTPQTGAERAVQIATTLGMAFTPTSKGFLSGNHEELQRASGEADDDSTEQEDEKKRRINRVYRYTYMDPNDNNRTNPMYMIAYQELYNPAKTEVVAIRVWKFVFDEKHSDSELWRKLMDENRATFTSAGTAHSQNVGRKPQMVLQQKQNRSVMGGINGRCQLEYYAGTQYSRILDDDMLLCNLRFYSGITMHGLRSPLLEFEKLPDGVTTTSMRHDKTGLGGTHPLSPEYVFNARRLMAFRAGLMEFDDSMIEVHPDQTDPGLYITDQGQFTVPQIDLDMGGFFCIINSSVTNIFDVALPRPLYGTASAGIDLLNLFRDVNVDNPSVDFASSASLSDNFNHMMTARDPAVAEMEKQMAEGVMAYDSIDVTLQDHKCMRHYGDIEDATDAYLIEPKQFVKEVQQQTRRVLEQLIEPWRLKREKLAASMNKELRTAAGAASDMMDCAHDDPRLAALHELEDETRQRHCAVMKDLINLHISRIAAAFESKMDRDTIPAGYCAMYDGLKVELQKTPQNTASVSLAFDEYLLADDVSSFAQLHMWLGQFFEFDCFIEGRDRRIMDEIFLALFEQYGDVTFLLLLCGRKGNGKTLRTERAQHVFPPDWVVLGGPSSAKGGMNGQSDSNNGKNVVYDEMIDDLCDSDGSDRLEYWKQIVLKREYVYQRTVNVKGPDGTETHKTMKLRTPHDETHIFCTNYGMAYTKDRDPSDTKFAMIDRSIAQLVRSIGKNAHTDNEFREHMSKPDQQRKLSIFRIFVCLVGATKLVTKGVPAFQPNLAFANKMFDYLDNKMVVGEYNLPRSTPRKSLKREENLRTMTVMNAVSKTACDFDAGRFDPDGMPPRFEWTMLYDVVRQLVPTPEQIFIAWSQGLDYNIGTSAHTFAAMTAVCEVFGIGIGMWMRKPPTENVDDLLDDGNAVSPSAIGQEPVRDSPLYANDERGDADFKQAHDAWAALIKSQKDDTELPSILPARRDEVEELVTSLGRQRRATSAYRHQCTLDGNSERPMSDPMETINDIMSKVSLPRDTPVETSSANSNDFLPYWPSCIMANVVAVSVLHSHQAVHNWIRGGAATGAEQVGMCAGLGTAKSCEFAKSKHKGGGCVWNTAWMRHHEEVTGWMGFARAIGKNNKTVKIFDLPLNGLRDLVYLLSTNDNARRCTETPRLSYLNQSHMAFVNSSGDPIGDGANGIGIMMRGITDSRSKPLSFGTKGKPRHPHSLVPDVAMQRTLEYSLNAGRLPAMMPSCSNKVTDAPPVRAIPGEGDKKSIELNTAAALEHTKMLAEASLRCSVIPGMENQHERFCDDASGPEGLCCAGTPSSEDDRLITKLPYSYDLMTISLTLDAMSRFYDPNGRAYVDAFREEYGKSLGLDATFESLPHMCLRFVGLKEERDRRLLSHKVPEERNPAFEAVEAGERIDRSQFESCHSMVSVTLGHYATDEEVTRYLKSRAGSRAMSGVCGDLLSMDTWLKHSATVLQERGMVSGKEDVVMAVVADDPYQLRSRVTEKASMAINQLVDKHPRLEEAEKHMPGDDRLSAERLAQAKEARRHRLRTELYNTMELPDHLEHLRHCGPLRITTPCIKRTYHNTKTKKRPAPAEGTLPTHSEYLGANTFTDGGAILKRGVKMGARGSGVQARGQRDMRSSTLGN